MNATPSSPAESPSRIARRVRPTSASASSSARDVQAHPLSRTRANAPTRAPKSFSRAFGVDSPANCARMRPRPAKTVRHDSHHNRDRDHRSILLVSPGANHRRDARRDARRVRSAERARLRATARRRRLTIVARLPSNFDRIATRRLARARLAHVKPRAFASVTAASAFRRHGATRPFASSRAWARALQPPFHALATTPAHAAYATSARAGMRSIERWTTNVVVDWGFQTHRRRRHQGWDDVRSGTPRRRDSATCSGSTTSSSSRRSRAMVTTGTTVQSGADRNRNR